MYELLFTEGTRWTVMAILIFAITFIFKYPYKKFVTDKIKVEKRRKLANKAIVIFTLALGIVLEICWCQIRGWEFTMVEFGYGLRQALTAIALYSALELKTDGAIENPFDNEDSREVIEGVSAFVTNEIKIDRKTKKKDNKEKTAHEKYMDLVGHGNEN